MYCPNCGFKVELKPHQFRPESVWDKAVRAYELQVSKGRTTYVSPPPKKKEKEEFTPETEKKKRYPEPAYDCDYLDFDGEYIPICSERSSRERLGFMDATHAHSIY